MGRPEVASHSTSVLCWTGGPRTQNRQATQRDRAAEVKSATSFRGPTATSLGLACSPGTVFMLRTSESCAWIISAVVRRLPAA